MKHLIFISVILFSKIGFGQIQLVPNSRVELKFEVLKQVDTVYRYEDMVFNGDTVYYSFRFENVGRVPASFLTPFPLEFDSLTFVKYYPKNPVRNGQTDSLVIGIPATLANATTSVSRQFVINSNSRSRDTLEISRIFQWTRDELVCDSLILGDSSVRLVNHITHDSDVLFVNVHANELTSVAAMYRYPDDINFIHLEQSAQRHIHFNLNDDQYSPDPNRIYSDSGRVLTIGEQVPFLDSALSVTKVLSKRVIDFVDDYKMIVAMHNNTDSFYSILSYQEGGGEAQNTKLLHVNPNLDPDDFIYTTSIVLFERFRSRGLNVILQDNDNCVDDGSLSVYCGKKGQPYVNIETQHGHLDEQLEIMKIVLEELRLE